MNIKQAKTEIKHTLQAYLAKDETGEYVIPEIRQRPMLLMGPPGIGKTQIMEQIARELKVGLVAYTITHHTRQSAVGLPFIREEEFRHRIYDERDYRERVPQNPGQRTEGGNSFYRRDQLRVGDACADDAAVLTV